MSQAPPDVAPEPKKLLSGRLVALGAIPIAVFCAVYVLARAFLGVGTVTEASLAFIRGGGRIESPWWAFTPEQTMYVQETQPIPPPLGINTPPEVFVFAGARAKLRAYNAFLQGQFRHSDLRYGEGDLNPVLGEAWAGFEMRTASGWALQYLVRWESPELASGPGSRSFMWGSIEVSKTFR